MMRKQIQQSPCHYRAQGEVLYHMKVHPLMNSLYRISLRISQGSISSLLPLLVRCAQQGWVPLGPIDEAAKGVAER